MTTNTKNTELEITAEDLMEDECYRYLAEESVNDELKLPKQRKIVDLLEGLNESEIYKGNTFKNYKDLCSKLNIPPKTSRTKTKQLQELEVYYLSYKKKGHSFIITSVHNLNEIQKQSRTMRTSYKDYIEELIISIMIDNIKEKERQSRLDDDESILYAETILSQGQLARAVGMVNKHYSTVMSNKGSYCVVSGHDRRIMNEWSDSFYRFLKRTIENAVNSLRDKRLIIYEMRMSVCDYSLDDFEVRNDADGDEFLGFHTNRRRIRVRLATPEEKSKIVGVEKEALNHLGAESISELFQQQGRFGFNQYKEIVNQRLMRELEIKSYFLSYALSFSDVILKNYVKTKDLDFSLTASARNEYKKQMNKMVRGKVQSNVEKRNTKALDKQEEQGYGSLNEAQTVRTSKEYLSTCENIANDILSPSNRVNHTKKILERKSYIDAIREQRNTLGSF